MSASVNILAERYAKALLALAAEASVAEEAGRQLEQLARNCFSDKTMAAFWQSSKIPESERQDVLQDALEAMDALTVVRNMANVLLERGRFALLPEVAEAYARQAREQSGSVAAEVTSAVELSPDLRETLRQGLAKATGRNVQLNTTVDPSLIGGVRVQLGNTIIDGSVRRRLQSVARSFQ